jgi:hypothetical protein
MTNFYVYISDVEMSNNAFGASARSLWVASREHGEAFLAEKSQLAEFVLPVGVVVKWRVDELKWSGVEIAFCWTNWVLVLSGDPSDEEVGGLEWSACYLFICSVFLLIDTSYLDDDSVLILRLDLDQVPVER